MHQNFKGKVANVFSIGFHGCQAFEKQILYKISFFYNLGCFPLYVFFSLSDQHQLQTCLHLNSLREQDGDNEIFFMIYSVIQSARRKIEMHFQLIFKFISEWLQGTLSCRGIQVLCRYSKTLEPCYTLSSKHYHLLDV